MATAQKPKFEDVPLASSMSFGIIIAEWHSEITEALLEGAYNTLIQYGTLPTNIIVKRVPGSFEITLGAQYLAEYTDVDAIICLGCIIKGETPHFDYVCQSVTHGITELNLQYGMPFIFGILTTNNYEQAKERAGGKYGNKGEEAAIAAIKMTNLKLELEGDDKY